MGIALLQVAAAAVLASAVNGRVFIPARPTGAAFVLPENGVSPRPTPPPGLFELRRRQDSSSSSIESAFLAPDNTCGYVSGRIGAAYTCNSAANCVFLTAVSTTPGAVACCAGGECNFRITCLDRNAVLSSSRCNDGCLVDNFTLKCTNSGAPFCNTISFPGGVTDYWCNTVDISTPMAAQTTYNGQTNAVPWSTVALTDNASSTIRPSGTRRPTSRPSQPGESNPDETPSTTPNPPSGGGSSTNVGAIVGGVIGGVAVLALIGFGIFFLLRHHKKNQQQAAPVQQPPAQYPPPMQQQSPEGGFGNPHQSFYDPSKQGMGAAPLVQQYQTTPPPGQEYGGTPPPAGYPPQQQPYYGATPDRTDTTSPLSQATDHRLSTYPPTSPGSTNQGFVPYGQPSPQHPPTIHEAGGTQVGTAAPNNHHRGEMHELA